MTDNPNANVTMDTLEMALFAELDAVPDMAEDALKMLLAKKWLTTCTNVLVMMDTLEMDCIVLKGHACLIAMECMGGGAANMQPAKLLMARKCVFVMMITGVMDSSVQLINRDPAATGVLDDAAVDMLAVSCQMENPNADASLAILEMVSIVMILTTCCGPSLHMLIHVIFINIVAVHQMLTALCTQVALGADVNQGSLGMESTAHLERLLTNVMVIMEDYVTKMLLALTMMVAKCVDVMKDTLEMGSFAQRVQLGLMNVTVTVAEDAQLMQTAWRWMVGLTCANVRKDLQEVDIYA